MATATLFLLIAGHSVRETARDTLFLTDLPATRLPWAYLAIAFGALLLGFANRHLLARFSHRRLLLYTLSSAALVDTAFWSFGEAGSHLDLFALYAWTGLFGTAVTLQLWLHLADSFTVTEAKRAFPWITAGGLAGAVFGSLLARTLLEVLDTRSLLLATAALSLATAAVAIGLPPRRAEPEAGRGERDDSASSPGLRDLAGSGYVRRIVLLSAAVAVLATAVDFVFKQSVANAIPTESLGSFFSVFYAAVNAFALCFELVVASWLLRRLGVTRTLFILPACLLASSGALVAVGGIAAAVVLKGVDGSLRPSLFGASVEVLFQPFSPQARNATKTAVESLGKRGGQAIGSLLILMLVGTLREPGAIAWAVLVCSALALLPLWGLRAQYVSRFHSRLSHLAEDAVEERPQLDLHSLEALVESLSSPAEAKVLAAIDLLESHGRARLVSPLILHHPSPSVVLRALELFRRAPPPHHDSILEQLIGHAEPDVRAAALDAIAARDPESPHPDRLLHSDPSPAVRATALVVLVARYEREEDGSAFLADLVAKGSREERIAIARALPRLPHRVASEAADALVALGDGAMSAALAQVLAGEPNLDSRWTGVLIALLAMRKARSAARAALIEVGEAALDELERALTGRDTDPSVRRHLPRTIHRFGSPRAAQILTRALPGSEPEVRYKILRGLGRMRADDPDLPIDADALLEEAWQALARAVEMLALRVAYRRAATSAADAESSGDLLAELLEDKEHRALERVFRALHIVQPEAGFEAIFEALHSLGRAAQAGGLELIEHLVDERLRDTLLAMVGSGSEEDRLREAARTHTPERAFDLLAELPDPDRKSERESAVEPPWEAVLGALLEDGDPILSSLARHRRDELRETGTNPLDGSENGWRPPARAAGNR